MNPNKREDISVKTLRKKQKADAMALTLTIILSSILFTTTTTAITLAALAQNPPICSDEDATLVGTPGDDNIVGTND